MIFVKKITNRHLYTGAEGYPFCLPVVRAISEFRFTNDVTFFIGENGSGKSTLVEAIAVAAGFNAEGGSKNFNFSTAATHSPLHEQLHITRGGRKMGSSYGRRVCTMWPHRSTSFSSANHTAEASTANHTERAF